MAPDGKRLLTPISPKYVNDAACITICTSLMATIPSKPENDSNQHCSRYQNSGETMRNSCRVRSGLFWSSSEPSGYDGSNTYSVRPW